MKKPNLAKQLEKCASRAFRRTRGVQLRFDDQLEQIALMESTYGMHAVLEDFEKWADEADKGCRYPLQEYLNIVDARLGEKPTETDDPRITEITTVVYDTAGDVPTKSAVKRLLEKFEVEDIVYGWSEFFSGLDEKKQGDAIRKFFSDGGCEAVLSKLKGS